MQTVQIKTAQNIDIDYEVADLGERVLGRLADIGIFVGLALVLLFLASLTSWNEVFGILLIIVYLVAFVFYDLLCELFFNGQSIGKRVMKIKVISIDGSRPSFGQYLIRWLFRIVDFSIGSGICALIAVAVSQKKQRIGDMVAGTTLIKTKPRVQMDSIAFMPVTVSTYQPVFPQVINLTDKDITLVHDVIVSYNATGNAVLVYNMALRIKEHLGITLPEDMTELQFLNILIKDYNHLSSISAEA
ncbi:hypothetical protein BEL04_18685 [Mucilaginibacter sp. PPCGB 2223]|uniref:RDD family protein n=1 Tax=Mucilaginibacter sp. PPCGB 2223 TaxID=1886027 RepID=UPI0008265C1D|nr:RDD family protein [Mucilaginibacter sp. PPCGB 2223]OCX50761.1 hypothetical protein BEL04_18685 [Mucilaginibacter sp. PPCGB 2223]